MPGLHTLLLLLIKIGQGTSALLLGASWGRKVEFSRAFRPLYIYFTGDVLLYILGFLAKKTLSNNIFIFHLSTLVDVTVLTIILQRLSGKKDKKLFKIIWPVFFTSVFLSAIWTDGLMENINILSRVIGNGILIYMCLHVLSQMQADNRLKYPLRNAVFVFCISTIIYYFLATTVILAQELPRYNLYTQFKFKPLNDDFVLFTLAYYPLLRAIQLGLLLHLITLFPMGITPRHALPRWLRFRLGWRPPTSEWRYRVLPPHLVG